MRSLARAATLAAALTLAGPAAAGPPPGGAAAGRFIEDDYARALAEARARDVPLLVDVWAPW